MAAAEARAVWQRTANRFFVQEDAKRAPKLACCQSSSSSKQADSIPIGVAGAHDQPAVGFMPLNSIAYYPNPPSDMSWWLQLQPSYEPQKGSTNELLNALDDRVESLKSEANSSSDVSRVHPEDAPGASGAGRKRNYEYSLDSAERMKNCELLEMESIECDVSKKTNELSYDLVSPWVGSGKVEPWWRVTDKDELASLVAKKSLDFIENCDLPPPQKMHIRRYYCECSGFDGDEVSSSAWKSQTDPVSCPIVNADAQCASNSSFCTTEKDFVDQVTESDPTMAQLLNALHHSQTRAREAEKAAKQAYAEKEHVIKLIFKQASQIYSYKQWFKMLHLDVYLQIKNNEEPVFTSNNNCNSRKSLEKTGKGRRGKQSQPRPSITTCAVAFALGLSIVSAGLLLGWTVGPMLPF
ncbi:Detected protein of unknown function [Hibiscus syriacus]|uniref:Uncharacterized protein n=1 Tax=Hibiscus syriacus TaxID=106335 RepID=A0A6A2WPW8_HIBSY|nr:uncharacterized protein LOC120192890 [Hibiscus syriacus]KAE8657745.1 Detected protein of unknown function [Hibiscus syriacus]